MSTATRAAAAMLLAAGALVAVAWLDTTVVQQAQREAAADFDASQSTLIMSVGSVIVMGTALVRLVIDGRPHALPDASVGAAAGVQP
jgi:hypothetical protein